MEESRPTILSTPAADLSSTTLHRQPRSAPSYASLRSFLSSRLFTTSYSATTLGGGDVEPAALSTTTPTAHHHHDLEASAARPCNPRDWSAGRKLAQVITVSLFTMMGPLSSSLPAPAAPQISQALGIGNEVESAMIVSLFVLGFAFGPLVLAPLCEVFGRLPLLHSSNLLFLVFNLACGFVQTKSELLVLRFLAGAASSGPLAIGAAVIADLYVPKDRNTALTLYSMGYVLGPAIGPLVCGFIATYSTWRWVFWASSIFCAVIAIAGLLFMRESHWGVIQARTTKKTARPASKVYIPGSTPAASKSTGKVLREGIVRPFILLFTQPIVIVLSIYNAFVYGLIYLVITTFATIYTSPEYYGEPLDIAGLHFIALGIGYILGAQVRAPLADYLSRRLRSTGDPAAPRKHTPEHRIPVIVPGALLIPAGLVWFGWTAQRHVFWLATDLGVVCYTAGIIIVSQGVQGYVIDAYTVNAASATAAVTFLRSLCGFGLPLAAPYMYASLGAGWGNTLLAGLALVLGLPAPLLLWFYGARLRAHSTYAVAPEPEADTLPASEPVKQAK